MTLYKNFVRPYLDYADIIYDQAYSEKSHQKLESIQYNVYFPLLGTIRGLSIEKRYQELDLESL